MEKDDGVSGRFVRLSDDGKEETAVIEELPDAEQPKSSTTETQRSQSKHRKRNEVRDGRTRSSSCFCDLCALNLLGRTSVMNQPKKVAAVVTEYRHWSHADVIVGKILEGYNYDGRAGPNLQARRRCTSISSPTRT